MAANKNHLNLNAAQMAKVISNADQTHSGQLLVWLVDSNTNQTLRENQFWVKAAPGFYGTTQPGQNKNKSSDCPRAYGSIPVPTPGNYVIVNFMNGDLGRGFWTNCAVQDIGQTRMMPSTPEQHPTIAAPAPDTNTRPSDGTQQARAKTQGIADDPIRGEGQASLHRDDAPECFNFNTPGGTQFIMDDKEGSAMVRIRTKSGVQLLISETEGHIYAITKDGKSWIELNNDGNVDIYSGLSVNIRALQNLNFTADQSIRLKTAEMSLEANNILIKSVQKLQLTSSTDLFLSGQDNINILSLGNLKMSSWSSMDIKSGSALKISASTIDQNSEGAFKITGASVDIKGPITVGTITGLITNSSVAATMGGGGPGSPATASTAADAPQGGLKLIHPTRVPTAEPFAGRQTPGVF